MCVVLGKTVLRGELQLPYAAEWLQWWFLNYHLCYPPGDRHLITKLRENVAVIGQCGAPRPFQKGLRALGAVLPGQGAVRLALARTEYAFLSVKVCHGEVFTELSTLMPQFLSLMLYLDLPKAYNFFNIWQPVFENENTKDSLLLAFRL